MLTSGLLTQGTRWLSRPETGTTEEGKKSGEGIISLIFYMLGVHVQGIFSGGTCLGLTRRQNAQRRGPLVSPLKFTDIATATTAIAGIIKRDLRRGIGKEGAVFMESIVSNYVERTQSGETQPWVYYKASSGTRTVKGSSSDLRHKYTHLSQGRWIGSWVASASQVPLLA